MIELQMHGRFIPKCVAVMNCHSWIVVLVELHLIYPWQRKCILHLQPNTCLNTHEYTETVLFCFSRNISVYTLSYSPPEPFWQIGGLLMKMLLSLLKLECGLISTKSFWRWYLLKWLFVCKCPRLTRACFLEPFLMEAEISQADSSQPGQINRLHCLIPRGVCDCFIVHDYRGIPFQILLNWFWGTGDSFIKLTINQ